MGKSCTRRGNGSAGVPECDVPGCLLYIRDRMLMAQPFDEKKLQIRGQAFPIAGPVLYDQLLWRGVFSCSFNGVLAYQGANNGQTRA